MDAAPHDTADGRMVILLAEDEPVVRSFVDTALTYAGYRVLVAADGAQALQLSRSYDGPIHLVLSDIKMPNMIGPELATVIEKERPGIRVLLMTGASSGEVPQQLRQDLLRKPFLPAQLLGKIAQALSSDKSSRG
jgi:two-component system cell cycle sensor histidine kinase/response regulator CckA